jgi:NAD-dependent SIR2 family protein deacetylase
MDAPDSHKLPDRSPDKESAMMPGSPGTPDPQTVARAAELIDQADGLVIAAGAGMGVDSGLPDFRGNAGFWRAYPALAASGIAFMDIASPAALYENPRRAWGFYGHRLALYRKATPHAGYELLRRWGTSKPFGSIVFTSNVDGHFHRAGFASGGIDECHGSIHALQCLMACSNAVWPASGFVPVVDDARCELVGPLPTCPNCGALARPNILMFNDSDWIDAAHERQALFQQAWIDRVRRPVVIEIGAGLNIPTVRHFSHRVARRENAALVRINPSESHVGQERGVGIAGTALATLLAIDGLLRASR